MHRVLLLGALCACGSEPRFSEGMELGGEWVESQDLNDGYELYMHNCYACHGEQGDGRGPAAPYLRPRPRDFTTGTFKFGGTKDSGLPHTADLVQLVRRGITGTAMLPWDVPEGELVKIVHYIKTFSKRWTDESSLGERIVPTVDPWAPSCAGDEVARKRSTCQSAMAEAGQRAIAKGRAVYHVNAQCRTCHPAYVTQVELWDITQEIGWGYADLKYRSELKKSDVFQDVTILPIDFLFHSIKTVAQGDDPITARARLYRAIGSGIPGAAMPTWKGALSEEDLWALTYYVQDLARIRQTPEARALRHRLDTQAPFTPPAAL
jgi:mono/diheme cytochrome c family protein